MKLQFFGLSETGSVRKHNEDAILMRSCGNAGIFLVADGVGGGESGEVVSGMLRDRFASWWETHTWDGSERLLDCLEETKELLIQINHEVVQRFGEYHAGSTVAMLLVVGYACAYISAGDSRIYKTRLLQCRQVTRDDTYENLPEEWAARFGASSAGKLVGAVGIAPKLEFSVRTDSVHRGDAFFLCSDGVYRYMAQKKLFRQLIISRWLLSQGRFSRRLCAEIERNGAGDNYSFVLAVIH